jgi:protein-arginine kinase
MSREAIIKDTAHHLSEEVRDVFFRHLLVMRAGGLKTSEATAAVLAAVHKLSVVTLGMAMAGAPEEKRAALADLLIFESAANLRAEVEKVLRQVKRSEQRTGAV